MSTETWRLIQLGVLLLWVPEAGAARPRVAIEPLELVEVDAAQREQLAVFYEVLLARVPNIRLAASDVTEAALAHSWRSDCPSDACTQALAVATDSLYAVFTELHLDSASAGWSVRGRVIRRDGVVARSIAFDRGGKRADVAERGRAALSDLVAQLDLGALPQALPVDAPLAHVAEASLPAAAVGPGREPWVAAREPAMGTRRAVGVAVFGLGAATLASGVVLAAVANVDRGGLEADARGNVPASHAAEAQRVVNESRAATVLLPVGAVLAAAGLTFALWPGAADAPRVAVAANGHGPALALSGAF